MIRLIRADGVEILLNVDLIKTVQATPDTVITLKNDEKLLVKNSPEDILEKVRAYRIGIKASQNDDDEPKEKKKK